MNSIVRPVAASRRLPEENRAPAVAALIAIRNTEDTRRITQQSLAANNSSEEDEEPQQEQQGRDTRTFLGCLENNPRVLTNLLQEIKSTRLGWHSILHRNRDL